MLGVLGGLVVLALVGFLAYQGLVVREGDPQLAVEVIAVEETPPGFVAQLRVRNDGGKTAQAVHIVGTVTAVGGRAEEATATIDYLSPSSTTEAALVFGADPNTGKLDVRVAGYTVP
ncbi:MAG: hypothetical protein M3257_07865 [Actinomycetota bacterium]|nr:hypothetical protein [Actinomycetota bacterium]